MNKPILSFVEIMVTQACNISCHGCTNYSDLPHAGYLTWEQGKKQIEPWLDRVEILDFGILGGEPLINPDIRNWIVGLRELLPNAQIRFTTNGLLLEKHYDVVQLLSDIGNSVFKITMHTNTTSVEKIIEKISAEYDWELVTEHGINRMKTKNNFRFQVNRPKVFIKSYVGTYPDIKPHHNNPVESFAICNQQMCPLMYNGKIYKTQKQEIFDVCGAGDVFLSSFVYKFLQNQNIEDSIIFANKCASFSVGKIGSYVLSQKDIDILDF